MSKVGRNQPCPCGSGKKHKACCLEKELLARRAVIAVATTPPNARFAVDGDEDLDDLDTASNRVVDLIQAGKLDEAEHDAREFLARHPDVHDGHDRLGMVFEARGDPRQAAHHYRQVIAFIEQHPDRYDSGFAEPFRRRVDRLDPSP